MTIQDETPFGSLQMSQALPRLLIVDDQTLNRQTLTGIFQKDHEILLAASGKQALEICRTDPPDLILLDIVMPDMDGLEVCRRLVSDPETKKIPVIFVTAQDKPEDETRGLLAGAVDFITKPVNPAVVRARVRTHLTLKAQADLLRSLAFVDGLTGVANRRRFDETLETEWRFSKRVAKPLALFMIDIDHFKKYNDNYGHQSGDSCLQEVAATIKRQLGRSHDLVARYGGEEFVCILPGVTLEAALNKAEGIVQAVRDLALPHLFSETASVVTISLGAVVTIPTNEKSPEALVTTADLQLYAAKRQGRNRVCGQEDL